MTPKYTDEELAECAAKAFDSKDYLGTPRWLRAFIAALPKRSGDSQLERELQTMTALADRLAEALEAIQKSAKYVAKKDHYLSPKFDPCRLAGLQIIGNAKESLAAYESHKKQTT